MNTLSVSLDDKWDKDTGRVLLTGTQAIVRIMLAQATRDARLGIDSAGFVSGYRGSPLGGVDNAFWQVQRRLDAARIRFQPGVNEELAASAVHGTQQVELLPGARHQGVFAAWYGKGPGVDRALDALKHGNVAGASAKGGVLCFYGDDHPGKSSTVAHQSEQALASCLIPSLYPSDVEEILRFGLLGFALSRFSGAWIGIKCVNETAEQTQSVDLALDCHDIVEPAVPAPPPEGVHSRFGPYNPLRDEEIAFDARLPRVHAFVRANNVDRISFCAARPRLGIVSAGKSHNDVREALRLLNLSDAAAASLGISLYKVGCIWPLEPQGLTDFAMNQQTLLIVEEKKSFLEQQAASILFNRADRPTLVGKRDECGAPLFSSTVPLTADGIAAVISARLAHLGVATPTDPPPLVTAEPATSLLAPRRSPYFCSGCPHNRSTRTPEGSLALTGIGCHAMVSLVRPNEALPSGQMGGEGANWIGIAPFTDTPHIFQNMGDGTYYHSGLLSIRAAVAAGVNITYKILYNDAVAMTGGQPVDGPISVADIVCQVRDEGVREVIVVSDDPARHAGTGLPTDVRVENRDDLDAVQRRLRAMTGTTVIVYEQTCAAEKRRRRKRGNYPDPAKRMFIATAVCEGCGDCSVQSTCVSVQPLATAMGTKRHIDQSSCNKDYSCANGFCPSFITVRGAEPRKRVAVDVDPRLFAELPDPVVVDAADVLVTGIGGTGVVTAAAVIGMAAHIDGKAVSLFDMTGLAQKNGAVFSHVRVAGEPGSIPTQRIARGRADVLLAFDAVAALAPDAASTLSTDRTRAVVNTDITTTSAFQFNRDFALEGGRLLDRLAGMTNGNAVVRVDATALSTALLGNSLTATSLLLGVASQQGLLPAQPKSIETALKLNGTAVNANLAAFRLGRLYVQDATAVARLIPSGPRTAASLPFTSLEIVAHRSAHLVRYQNETLAARYRALVERVRDRETAVRLDSDKLAAAVAANYAKLLAYKDEYEVARLLTDVELHREIAATFADGARLSFNMAPPMLSKRATDGRPAKREFSARILPLLRLLALGRRLRGSWADPFGYTAERRSERALIAEYEALVDRVLAVLSADNHARAVATLDLADEIRGYGPVKDAAIIEYRRKVIELEAGLLPPMAAIVVGETATFAA